MTNIGNELPSRRVHLADRLGRESGAVSLVVCLHPTAHMQGSGLDPRRVRGLQTGVGVVERGDHGGSRALPRGSTVALGGTGSGAQRGVSVYGGVVTSVRVRVGMGGGVWVVVGVRSGAVPVRIGRRRGRGEEECCVRGTGTLVGG